MITVETSAKKPMQLLSGWNWKWKNAEAIQSAPEWVVIAEFLLLTPTKMHKNGCPCDEEEH